MAEREIKENCFTFVWKLKNASYCFEKKGELIESPAFVVDAIEKTKWRIQLYPRGDTDEGYIGCFLYREPDSEGADVVEIKYDFSLVSKDSTSLNNLNTVKNYFEKDIGYGSYRFKKREDVFTSKRSTFLSEDTLRIRCRIWKSVGKMVKDVQCIACTHIGVEKRCLMWNVKNFSTLKAEKKCIYHINSKQNDAPLLSIGLSFTEGLQSEDTISFELFLYDQTAKFCTLKLFLIDASGKRVECNQEEIWFDDSGDCKKLIFSFTKNKLLEEESGYLLKDTLSLLWDWAFSRGVVSEETEVDDSRCICPEIQISDALEVNYYKSDFLNTRFDNVKSLYDENFLSDVKLKTNTGVFSAHKLILSASSSVFKAMFSNDMKEKDSNSVNIEDLSDGTISQMLHFIYTASVEDLTWENASRLYVAADKYAILSLKKLCSFYIKDHLSPENSCEILLLSDLHSDCELKSAVQDYILKHGKQVTNSDEWKNLVEKNAKLAVETLRLLLK